MGCGPPPCNCAEQGTGDGGPGTGSKGPHPTGLRSLTCPHLHGDRYDMLASSLTLQRTGDFKMEMWSWIRP
jgi:hypothetical protein